MYGKHTAERRQALACCLLIPLLLSLPGEMSVQQGVLGAVIEIKHGAAVARIHTAVQSRSGRPDNRLHHHSVEVVIVEHAALLEVTRAQRFIQTIILQRSTHIVIRLTGVWLERHPMGAENSST